MSHWNSAQQLCQQNMVLINYGNQLINPVLFTGRKWTWKHWGILQSETLSGRLHNRFLQRSLGGKVNVSPASFKKSFLFRLLNYTAKLLTASTSWKSWQLWTCITKKKYQYSEFLTFPFPWEQSEPQTQPFTQTVLNCVKKHKAEDKTHCFTPFASAKHRS